MRQIALLNFFGNHTLEKRHQDLARILVEFRRNSRWPLAGEFCRDFFIPDRFPAGMKIPLEAMLGPCRK